MLGDIHKDPKRRAADWYIWGELIALFVSKNHMPSFLAQQDVQDKHL